MRIFLSVLAVLTVCLAPVGLQSANAHLPVVSSAASALERCPGSDSCFSFGYVDANVTVKSPRPFRVKVASPVFSFCYAEVSPNRIAKDAKPQIEADIRSQYGSDFEITYIFTAFEDTREKAERNRSREMANENFKAHIESRYHYVVYSSKCRN